MIYCFIFMGFPGGSNGKISACNARDSGSPGLRRSPREGNGNPLQYSCLGNPIDRGAWRATVHGVAENWTQLSNYYLLTFSPISRGQRSEIKVWARMVPARASEGRSGPGFPPSAGALLVMLGVLDSQVQPLSPWQ